MLRIEPVPPSGRQRALELLTESDGRPGTRWRGLGFRAFLTGPDAARCRLWWARTLRGGRAAAITIRNPGRTAMIFCGPIGLRRRDILTRLITELTAATLDDGIAFVQVMFRQEEDAHAEPFRQAGYFRLAELVYLRRDLRKLPDPPRADLTFEPYRPEQRRRLQELIEETYVGSLDCPALRGLRRMEDVVVGHQASGKFRPESWWTVLDQGQPAGCVLVNDCSGRGGAADVVYLGVRPKYRRRGLARAMLRHAMTDAAGRGLHTMTLAVDGANEPARKLYEQEDFREDDRRVVYIRPAKPPPTRPHTS